MVYVMRKQFSKTVQKWTAEFEYYPLNNAVNHFKLISHCCKLHDFLVKSVYIKT